MSRHRHLPSPQAALIAILMFSGVVDGQQDVPRQQEMLGRQDPATQDRDRQDAVELVAVPPVADDASVAVPRDIPVVDRRPRLFRAKLVSNLILVPSGQDQSSRSEAAASELIPLGSGVTNDNANRRDAPPDRPQTPDRPRAIADPNTVLQASQSAVAAPPSEAPPQWLDVRPRTLDKDHASIIPVHDLPADTSHLPPQSQIPELIELYSFELHRVDFCASAAFCHRPLYFEDRLLERYGISHGIFRCVPPVQSGFCFLSRTALLPVNMLHERPCSCVRSECICK
jgi:hypothetical protein